MKILIEHSDLFSPMLHFYINESVNTRDITSHCKNGDAFAKKNYRLITVPLAMSKIHERIISYQISDYIDYNLSPYLCAYRKGYNTQHALLKLVEKCRSYDLSKALDCLNHELLIEKLGGGGYGFSRSALMMGISAFGKNQQKVYHRALFRGPSYSMYF